MLDVSSLDGALPHGAWPGELLADKYRVERVLGRGGMGVVVLARNVRLGQHVAIKFLGREPTRELATRLLHEARAAAQLSSDHVVRVFDVAEMAGGAPYIVMEYLEGEGLDRVLRRAGRLPWADAVQCVLEACEGLALAHRHAIVHRDLKPANLFVERRPDGSSRVKVLDFGVAKLGAGLGATTHPVGSPAYMAPEQLESSSDVDARADIWGGGVVLYELVTGSTPFRASSLLELAVRVREAAHVPAHELCAELPPGLSDVIERCLSKARDERFASVRELVAALCPFGPAGAAAVASRIDRLTAPSRAAPPPLATDDGSSEALDAARDGARRDHGRDDRLEARALSEAAASSRHRNISGLATTLAEPSSRASGSRLGTLAVLTVVGVAVAWAAAGHPERTGTDSATAATSVAPGPSAPPFVPGPPAIAPHAPLGGGEPPLVGARLAREGEPVPLASSNGPSREAAAEPVPARPAPAARRAPRATPAAAPPRGARRAPDVEVASSRASTPSAPEGAPAPLPPIAPAQPEPASSPAVPAPVGPLPLDRELSW
ncbi:MAG TPA: serine/threonine-protein kinase [Polyangiaceae bacterium]|nr:serine/threonine-protein kinase [Polyangiaceae bacterium]